MNILKKVLIGLLLIAVPVGMAFAGGEQEQETDSGESESALNVVLYLNGNLGDKAFFDSANRGVLEAEEDFDISVKVIEGGYDPSRWGPDLNELCKADWDIVIAGTWQLQEFVQELAPKYPEKKFITFDTSVDYSKDGVGNVYSILYKQNEASFLGGALASMITTSDMEYANPEENIAVVAGMDIPVINDFKVGFIQGAEYINSSVDVSVSYAGTFNDPAKGKELAFAMFDQGADVAFNCAAQTGLGVLDAGTEKERYTIGVDSDQYLLYKESEPERAAFIVTSVMKNIDESLYRALKLHQEGTLKYGEAENLGIKENGVGLAINENYKKLVPQDFQEKIQELSDQIENGEIAVDSAFE
ncbi:MAG: BMP family ABC transporter substrate-binding protein [Spirochaetales bacterium]|nr:BMP family ABC transporter substrate-binding protein [Spirochaetales bacterium]MCF7939240.1 BMP family ABC transporter substrate-binding protein [Spirochaetales bacterium]